MQLGFFDLTERLSLLEKLGDPLPRLNEVVDWEGFRPTLSKLRKETDPSKGGRPPFDLVLMLKVLVLQQLYNLSDDQTEYQIRDRYSFCRFLGLNLEDRVPDAKTIWAYRERLKEAGLTEALFSGLLGQIEAAGFVARSGQIVDASVVPAPRQRNTPEENAQILQGQPPVWKKSKARQKDVEARWASKYGKRQYGYKNHVNIDREHKIVRRYRVSDAARHDGPMFESVFDESNGGREVWADAAYGAGQRIAALEGSGYRSRIQRQGQSGKPLSEDERARNRRYARVRLRVEHVFAAQEQMGGRLVRTIGLARATVQIGMKNFAYNLKRFAWLVGHDPHLGTATPT